jgi:hypothetical protein
VVKSIGVSFYKNTKDKGEIMPLTTHMASITPLTPTQKNQFDREKSYQVLMHHTANMNSAGIISQEDYANLGGYFRSKYRPLRTFSIDIPARNLVESALPRGSNGTSNRLPINIYGGDKPCR